MPKLQIEPSDDGTKARITADTTDPIELGADAIDYFIKTLVSIRAHMEPPLAQEQVGEPAHSHPATRWAVTAPLEDDPFRLQLGLFHPGLGWLVTHLRSEQARDLRRHLDDALTELPRL